MRFLQFAIAFDQLANTLFGGYADETLSARAWRQSKHSKRWQYLRRVIDGLFFWQSDHCFNSYLSELHRKHLPQEYDPAGCEHSAQPHKEQT